MLKIMLFTHAHLYVCVALLLAGQDVSSSSLPIAVRLSRRRAGTVVGCCTLLLYRNERGQFRCSKLAFDLGWS
jgi:hypothetical protein